MPKHMCPSKYCVGWNAAEMKYVNRTCFHIGLKSQTIMSLFHLSCECTRRESIQDKSLQ